MPTPTRKQTRLIKTTGEIIPCRPKNGKDFKLEELRELIRRDEHDDVFIEVVPIHRTGEILICDEDGEGKGLPTNETATVEFCNDVIQGSRGVVGNVVICGSNMLK